MEPLWFPLAQHPVPGASPRQGPLLLLESRGPAKKGDNHLCRCDSWASSLPQPSFPTRATQLSSPPLAMRLFLGRMGERSLGAEDLLVSSSTAARGEDNQLNATPLRADVLQSSWFPPAPRPTQPCSPPTALPAAERRH